MSRKKKCDENGSKLDLELEIDAGNEGASEKEELSFQEALEKLQSVIKRLESEDLPLEEAVRQYEEGVGLARRLAAVLKKAEEKVVQLSRGRDGELDLVEFVGMGDNSGVS
ncbi:MAG: exodeoxyribonuclease VII small subunit [Chloroflexi bacterium]|nr:exodeoxyribonuclease VII small subunit [Chloroflexota bacterium]